MRTKKAILNIGVSLMLEIVTIVYGFVVPRLFISSFGSEVNGLISSMTNFIGYITLLQSGVGSVVKATLYKPLAQKKREEISVIVKTASAFFSKIAVATVVYLGVLSVAFPLFIAPQFDFFFTASLVVIVGLSTAAQYFFGITYQMLLEADQKAYIYSIAQIVSILINTILVVVLINSGCSIHIVKLASTVIYIARPVLLGFYARKKYQVNSKVEIDNKIIKQRWDGFVQAIALFIHQKTDVFVLTLFSTLSNVSVYSVYALVTGGLSAVINAIDKAVRSAFGNIIACDENENLKSTFEVYNSIIHILATVCFSTASVTVFQFVTVYMKGVVDANYIQTTFGILIIAAEYIYCLRSPYNTIIYAAGKFKETKKPAGIEAIVNIVVSCALVSILGLSGVAIGTLVAMSYRTVSFVNYLRLNVLYLDVYKQIQRYAITVFSYVTSIFVLSQINRLIIVSTYLEWCCYAVLILVLSIIIVISINLFFDRRTMIRIFDVIKSKLRAKRREV